MNVFITGGTSGIGEALALHYARISAENKVGICSHEPVTYAQSLALKNQSNIYFYTADVTDLQSMQQAVQAFVKIAGTLDLMIANAGISYRKKTYDQPIAESLRIIDVNVKGVMNTFEAAISFMRQQESGHIVAMSSIAASNGLPTRAAYSASKNAVQIWCESMAIELSRFGVVVSCVKPGFIKSHLTSGNQHAMPFALTIEETVQNILSGIKKQKFLITFPWPMVWLTNLLSFLPRPLYILIMKIGAGWLQDKKE